MSDPFQAQRRPAQSKPTQAMGPLRDTSSDARLLRPRSKRLLHAVKMLDVLTSGDEGLHAYLSAKAGEAKPAFDPFAAKRGAVQPALQEDPIDAMTQTAPPPVGTQEFQELKDGLRQQCQEMIRAETVQADKVVYLAPCGLPFHRIHWIDDAGEIIRHYRLVDLNTPLLRMADELLYSGFILVEVHGGFPNAEPGTVLYAANKAGEVEKVTF